MKDMRTIFMGSPDFAIPTLEKLFSSTNLAAVVTQPDRPAGRGRSPSSSAVKQYATKFGVQVFQPEKIASDSSFAVLRELDPDIIIVAAYGQIIKKNLLALPKYGCVNVHASLLPRWRGASPIQAAILAGDSSTGVTIMLMDEGLDTGPILSQVTIPIPAEATGGDMFTILSQTGADLLIPTLHEYITGEIEPVPQNNALATYAPMIKKSQGLLLFSKSANVLANQIRAFEPWPGSFFHYEKNRILVRKAHTTSETKSSPGIPFEIDGKPAISCSKGSLVLDEVQPAGKKRMPGDAFLNGARNFLKSAYLIDAKN